MKPFPTAPPISPDPRPWDFPQTSLRQLSNGIQVAVIRMPALPIVSVRWCMGSGRLHEPLDQTGAGFLLQRMLRHGTEELSSADFARHLDRRGIRLGTQVSVDSTVVSVSALREYLSEAIQIASGVVFRPRLPEPALVMERIRATQMHQQALKQVEALTEMGLARSIYGAHPYGRPTMTLSGLQQTKIEDIRTLHGRICDPSKALLLVVGDVDADEVMDAIARRVSTYSAPGGSHDWSTPEPPTEPPRVVLVECPDAEQVAIGVGVSVMPRNHPDFLALRVVNHILGGGGSSRLFSQLRERQGLTYGVYSQLDCGRWGGDLTATMQVAPEKLGVAISSLSDEMTSIGQGEIGSAELKHAIDYLVGSFPQRASGLGGVSSLTMAAWLHQLPSTIWRDYQTEIQAVTKDGVENTAKRWLQPDKMSWVISGPPDVLDSVSGQLRSFQKPIERLKMESFSG